MGSCVFTDVWWSTSCADWSSSKLCVKYLETKQKVTKCLLLNLFVLNCSVINSLPGGDTRRLAQITWMHSGQKCVSAPVDVRLGHYIHCMSSGERWAVKQDVDGFWCPSLITALNPRRIPPVAFTLKSKAIIQRKWYIEVISDPLSRPGLGAPSRSYNPRVGCRCGRPASLLWSCFEWC